MKCIVIVQARLASKRLPKKVLAPLGTSTVLQQIVRRCRAARTIDDVIVACPTTDDQEIFEQTGIQCLAGSETDLYDRLLSAAKANNATHFVRVTGDCPFVCPRMIEHLSWLLLNGRKPITANWKVRGFPDGLDLDAWEVAWLNSHEPKDHEYFAQEFVQGLGPAVESIENPVNLSTKYRLTLDYPEDLDLARIVYAAMGNELWDSQQILDYLEKRPKVRKMNLKHIDGFFGMKVK